MSRTTQCALNYYQGKDEGEPTRRFSSMTHTCSSAGIVVFSSWTLMSGPLLVTKLAEVAERHEQIQGIWATREDETPIAYCTPYKYIIVSLTSGSGAPSFRAPNTFWLQVLYNKAPVMFMRLLKWCNMAIEFNPLWTEIDEINQQSFFKF